jgi:uncharacterized membrane protein YoaK (UPF0700 family)
MKPSLPILLSVNGGYVDAAGYLALHGLIAAWTLWLGESV